MCFGFLEECRKKIKKKLFCKKNWFVFFFSFFVVTIERVNFFASGIVLAGPTPAILLDYDGLAGMLELKFVAEALCTILHIMV